jgi:predicted kinase
MEMIILMGLQASGKSTFYRTYFAATHEHVSKDLLLKSKNKNKDQKQAELIEGAFQEQRSVVIDNTNATKQDRLLLIELGRRYDATIIGYYEKSDLKAPVIYPGDEKSFLCWWRRRVDPKRNRSRRV